MIKNLILLPALVFLLPFYGHAQWALTAAGSSFGTTTTIGYSVGEIFTTPIGNPCVSEHFLVGVIQSSAECPVGVEDVFGDQYYLKCYPNPTEDRIVIETDFPDFREYRIANPVGKTVAWGIFDNPEIDLAALSPGLYLVTLTSNDQTIYKTFKIIKQ